MHISVQQAFGCVMIVIMAISASYWIASVVKGWRFRDRRALRTTCAPVPDTRDSIRQFKLIVVGKK